MAVEVARVHGLICSNMRDDGDSEDGAAARRDPNFCYDFHFDTNSRQAGSVGSSPCSTESESDEDSDYIAGLAQQIARSMLEDDDGLDTGSTKNSAGCGGAETEPLKVCRLSPFCVSYYFPVGNVALLSARTVTMRTACVLLNEKEEPDFVPVLFAGVDVGWCGLTGKRVPQVELVLQLVTHRLGLRQRPQLQSFLSGLLRGFISPFHPL